MSCRRSAVAMLAILVPLLLLAACNQQGGTTDARPDATGDRPASGERRGGETARGAADGCDHLPSSDDLRRFLREAPGKAEAGGLMSGKMMWGAVVNRSGVLCAVATSTDDVTAPWPGSQAIAKAKAYTANAFSTNEAPLSTARLYTLTQPGHSLFGAGAGNPLNAECLVAPGDADDTIGKVCGGAIVFGGGLALYREGVKVGGLGVSGDTSCADHEIAKAVRDLAGLTPPGGRAVDDIVYAEVDGPSLFAHPLCPNTFKDGQKVGDEKVGAGN